jgi:putative heme iron utilization protein
METPHPMKPTIDTVLHLLHSQAAGALATQSVQLPGYPFATALPYVPDEAHRPVFLLSTLAEHTKNLLADPHVSLLVTVSGDIDVLELARMTLAGDATRIDASDALRRRYLRYRPEAEQYLSLGDFLFVVLNPVRCRYIGGFAQMGWLEAAEWKEAAILPLEEEEKLLARLGNEHILGIDYYGVDLLRDGKRKRLQFAAVCRTPENIELALRGLPA